MTFSYGDQMGKTGKIIICEKASFTKNCTLRITLHFYKSRHVFMNAANQV